MAEPQAQHPKSKKKRPSSLLLKSFHLSDQVEWDLANSFPSLLVPLQMLLEERDKRTTDQKHKGDRTRRQKTGGQEEDEKV
jgi:hypothetical protein